MTLGSLQMRADPAVLRSVLTPKMHNAESILLPLQVVQQRHDEVAHRDILSFDLYKRLKHMVLHFYKYAGKVEEARMAGDQQAFRSVLLDTFIICMASANALNISLGASISVPEGVKNFNQLAQILAKNLRAPDLYADALRHLLLTGGKMAKAIESSDHMENGNPRADMEALVPQLASPILALLGALPGDLETELRKRLSTVEQRSILLRPVIPAP